MSGWNFPKFIDCTFVPDTTQTALWTDRFKRYVPAQQAATIDIGVAILPFELDDAAKQFLDANPDCPLPVDELLKAYLLRR